MPIVPLFGTGLTGKSAVLSSQRRINAYYEPQPDSDKTRFGVIGLPGLVEVLNLGAAPGRGWITEDVLLYAAQGSTFWEINNAFVSTSRGTLLTSSGRLDMASNGAVIVIVDGTYGYTYTISTATLAQITDADFPANPQTVSWQDGQFAVTFSNTGPVKQRVYISPDGINWDALDFRAAESTPDGLIRGYSYNEHLHCFGEASLEFWAYTGDGDFPFAPVRGAGKKIGLASRWSLAEFDQSLCFLGKNKLGEVQVYRLAGYELQQISTPDLNTLINAYSVKSDAQGFSYMLDGHPMYELAFPTAGKSWLYDGLSSAALGSPVWSETTSDGGRHYAAMQVNFLDRPYVSDYRNGRIYRLDKAVYADAGVAQEFQVDTRHFFKDHDRVTVDRIYFDLETGVGLTAGQGSNPKAMLKVSRDGGRTWGSEMWANIGKIGKYLERVEFRRLGTARDFVFSLRITDPVKRVITGISIDADPEIV